MHIALTSITLTALLLAPAAAAKQSTGSAPAQDAPKAQPGQTAPSQTATPVTIRTGQAGQDGITRGSALVGKQIYDSSGAAAGEIKDLVVDSSGEVIAIIDQPGAAGGLAGVPLNSLKPDSAAPANVGERNTGMPQTTTMDANLSIDRFVFSGDVQQLQTAPALTDLSKFDDAWVTATRQHFGIATPVQDISAGAGAIGENPRTLPRRALSFGTLTRSGVTSMGGQRLGDFRDVAVTLPDGRVSYVVFGRTLSGRPETLHGVALDSLQFDDQNNATLDIDEATLDQSTGLTIDRLPRDPSLRVAKRATPDKGRAGDDRGADRGTDRGADRGGNEPDAGSSTADRGRGGSGSPR